MKLTAFLYPFFGYWELLSVMASLESRWGENNYCILRHVKFSEGLSALVLGVCSASWIFSNENVKNLAILIIYTLNVEIPLPELCKRNIMQLTNVR